MRPKTVLLLLAVALTRCADRSLSEVHTRLACGQCHAGWQHRLQPAARCLACHAEIETSMAARRGYHGHGEARVQRCGACHVEHGGPSNSGWKQRPEEFRAYHATDTGFPLDGAHERAPCAACHESTPSGRRSYRLARPDCQSCHTQRHQLARRDLTCTRCHDTQAWRLPPTIRFDHNTATRFPLLGSHAVLICGACHGGRPPVFARSAGAVPACVTCHGDQDPHHRRVGREPAHHGGAATQCQRCHDPQRGSWSSPRSAP